MKLSDFEGKRKFSGIDKYYDSNGDGYIIRIDNKNYTILEDEDDGYRSYLGEIEEVDIKIDNMFEPIDVMCKMKDDGYTDALNVTDCKTLETILIIGTENYDDYYPMCVMEWYPKKMIHNINKGE
ncbi:hypothetical protein N9924_00980 [bacterium]|nr:hypothetical protein [bacterium]